MKLRILSADDVQAALPMVEAVAEMKAAFAALSTGAARTCPRVLIDVSSRRSGGATLLMGAHVPQRGLAAKIVTVFPENRAPARPRKGVETPPVINGLVVVLDATNGTPLALLDGAFLTAWRTGAASGAATDLLAREDAAVGAILGCGAQARTQALGVDAVRRLEVVRVYAPRPERVAAFIAEVGPLVRARLVPARSAAEAVADADIVCAATTSTEPVFDGDTLRLGAHVNGVGSFRLDMREIDVATIARARVFVDSIEGALNEAGDLVAAERARATSRSDWIELGLVAAGDAPGRTSPDEITFFKSVGQSVQDAAAAGRAYAVAVERGLGSEIEL